MKELIQFKSTGWVYTCFIFLVIVGCDSDDDASPQSSIKKPQLTAEQQYFLKISLGGELANIPPVVKKWNQDIRIFVVDTTYTELMQELNQIIAEINDLSTTISLNLVATRTESNYLIYFGDAQTYATEYEPAAAPLVEENWGIFWIYWNAGYSINRGSMYVDTERTESLVCQKHLLREELTQSLGLMQDTNDFLASIFYQPWTCTPRYADIDEQLIRWQLSEEIKTGMNRTDIITLWQL
ncbi:DUF2927 domain-containing protein [Tunicatimonas pelagia]|uniref:DUF2927 domain-containing protein n=1 Tax=Tunicatimonas pelagia TaxID=931531 RepID=UPI002666407D|nr:DUF2927 domain-containing protein [Tunicatimonas pelagia]WKN41739.1 DUF2927 domain-containing protein [Tunicatimonas pelagia]